MGRIAALFPGQGSQYVGMGKDLAGRWSFAREVFDTADAVLKAPLSRIAWEGPDEELRLTANTQPALLAHSVAAWRALEGAGVAVDGVAGHSLGEYSAAVAAGAMGLDDALRTVRRRGQLMQEAVPVGEGAMAAVIGLDDGGVGTACSLAAEATGQVVVPVNFNAPGQVVIAGAARAVERAGKLCREAGARRVVPLAVSAPFHSPLMAPAREGLAPVLEALGLADPRVPLYRNVDARPVRRAEELREGLLRQVDSPVLWTATVEAMIADGFDTFVEVGAGKVLSGLVRRVSREVRCLQAGTVDQVEAVVAELGRSS